jgi:DNA-directed RNA polymerase subunit RPC12/RpoP
MTETDSRHKLIRDECGGPVDSEVSYFRNAGVPIRFPVINGVRCHRCGSPEVYQPMQTMDMPMLYDCLKCGKKSPASRFNSSTEDN